MLPPETTASDHEATADVFRNETIDEQFVIPQHDGATTTKDKIRRVVWNFVWITLFRPSPRPCFGWRRFLLRSFGARCASIVYVYPTAKIYAPWNLEMGLESALGPDVDCYCMAQITLGSYVTVSQYSYLCSGTHDIHDPAMRLCPEPISIHDCAWVCADSFIGPGVTVGRGAVVGARSSVFRNVEPWTVVGGNPARFIKKRELRTSS